MQLKFPREQLEEKLGTLAEVHDRCPMPIECQSTVKGFSDLIPARSNACHGSRASENNTFPNACSLPTPNTLTRCRFLNYYRRYRPLESCWSPRTRLMRTWYLWVNARSRVPTTDGEACMRLAWSKPCVQMNGSGCTRAIIFNEFTHVPHPHRHYQKTAVPEYSHVLLGKRSSNSVTPSTESRMQIIHWQAQFWKL